MKFIYASILALSVSITTMAQTLSEIELKTPTKTGGLSIMETFDKRQSSEKFADKEIEMQDLSNLLWAANGINRDNGKKTAPSSQNTQDIDIYVALPNAVYKFDAANNKLILIAEGDYRALSNTRKESPIAPCVLYLTADASKYNAKNNPAHVKNMNRVDAGIVSQNISVFCAGMGLKTKPRAQMNHAELNKVLKLTNTQTLILNHPIGYSK